MVSCQLPLLMAKEIACKNGRISNCEELVTLTLTLDQVILHTVVHKSSTSTYMPNFTEIKGTFHGWTDVVRTDLHTYARTDRHLRLAVLGWLCRRVSLKSKGGHITKYTITQSQKLKPDLVASYDLGPGNGMVLFLRSKSVTNNESNGADFFWRNTATAARCLLVASRDNNLLNTTGRWTACHHHNITTYLGLLWPWPLTSKI